ncbi:uncharacterized membrane protein HdeD (DUF308 family) [Humitalea rosea]|uniref:Uncharacterized membrane protein HdeD (DUF308 family) n=1 Tax=Humitalea rosea TaxID=990373 RepID=A0A2W7ILE2_9PROT|nr:DUF308 domain-containing protein [Humitalea rosea]PZW46827.1 uncharacterized membrane protein HdeD (DUF308 family) [Humitalea rosea]
MSERPQPTWPVLEPDRNVTAWWWVVGLRGVVAIAFGLLLLFMPGLALSAVVVLFGAFAIVDGSFALAGLPRGASGTRRRGTLLAEALLSIAGGLVAVLLPEAIVLVFVYFVAAWGLLSGGALLFAHSTALVSGWFKVFVALASIGFGVLVLLSPAAGLFAITLWMAVYAMLFGAALLSLALQLRRWHEVEPLRRS